MISRTGATSLGVGAARTIASGRCRSAAVSQSAAEVGPEVDDCQTLSAGSGGESENPQLMATPRWEAGEQQRRTCAIQRSRVERGAQSSLHGGGRHVLAGNSYASLDPSPA